MGEGLASVCRRSEKAFSPLQVATAVPKRAGRSLVARHRRVLAVLGRRLDAWAARLPFNPRRKQPQTMPPASRARPSPLFTPLRMGAFELAHRVVMPAIARRRARPVGIPTPMMAEHYAQRASAGGLIVGEPTGVSADGHGDAAEPGLHNAEQVNHWRRVTDAVHARGALMLAQLEHRGRLSAFGCAWSAGTTATTTDAIDLLVEDFRNAAENAGDAGFDGVELQAGGGSTVEQILLHSASAEAGAHAVADLVGALAAVWGAERVGIHLPWPSQAAALLLADLYRLGIAYVRGAAPAQEAAVPRSARGCVWIAAGACSADEAAAGISAGRFDAADFGLAFVANPDLPVRLRHGHALASPTTGSLQHGGALGYTDYPTHPPRD